MLRAAIGFEHCARNVIDTWMASSGWAISRHPTYPTYGKGLIVDSDGWLTVPEGLGASGDSFVWMDWRQFMDTSSKAGVISFGFRAKLKKAGIEGLGNLSVWAAHGSSRATHAVATQANMFPAGTPEGTECLVEIVLDMNTTYRYTYVNGVMLGSTVYNGLSTVALKAGDFGIFLSPCVTNTTAVVAYRDFWITDDIPGDGIVGRMGDMKVRPITVSGAAGAGWAASDGGTLLAALTQPLDKVNPAVIDSTLGASPLALTIANTIGPDLSIKAVQFFLNSKSGVGTAQTEVSLERNGLATPKRRVPLDTTMQTRTVAPFHTAPDGSPWTPAKLASTTIKITPE